MNKKWSAQLVSTAVALALAAPYAGAANHRGTSSDPFDLSTDPLLGDTELSSQRGQSGDVLDEGLPQSLGSHNNRHKHGKGGGGTGNPPPPVGGAPGGGCDPTVVTTPTPPAPPPPVTSGGHNGGGQHHRLSNSIISSPLVSKRSVVVADSSPSSGGGGSSLGSHVNFHKGHKGSGLPPPPVTPPSGNDPPPTSCPGDPPPPVDCTADPTDPSCKNNKAPEPGTLTLVSLALAALALLNRRRSRR